VFLFVVSSFITFSQNLEEDTARINQANSDAFKLYGVDASQMLEVGSKTLLESEEIHYERGEANSYNTIALAYLSMAEYEKAIENFLKALEIYERVEADKYVASILSNIGVVYYYLEDHEQSLSYHLRTLKARELMGGDSSQVAKSLNNIGIAYKNLDQLDNALDFYKRALTIKIELKDSAGVSNTLNNIGNVYLTQKRFQEAQSYFYQSLVLDSLLNRYAGMAISYLNLGSTATEMEKTEEAAQLLGRSILLATEYDAKQTRLLAYEKLSELSERNDDFEEAFLWKTKWVELKDSLKAIANSQAINELTAKYENEKIKVENELLKEKEIAKDKQIEQQGLLIAAGILLMGSFVTTGFFFLKSYRLRQFGLKMIKTKNEEIIRKNELISSQNKELSLINEAKNKMFAIMSHDLKAPFNNLNSFIYMASNKMLTPKEIPKLLKDIAGQANHVSDLITNVLEWMKTQMSGLSIEKKIFKISPLANEVFDAYKLQATTKNIKLKNLIDDATIAFGDENLTRTIIRNLVANAIKFTENGTVGIASRMEDDMIHVSVFDSGIGMKEHDIQKIYSNDYFSNSGTSEEVGTGLGLILIKEFVVKNGGILKIRSEFGIGSTFTFTMPIKETDFSIV
jgi:signal transduction histidine kinase/Tfp pilus assembly protein PilF